MAYLQAMGVESHVSRFQLPGAATTRRLAIVNPAAHIDHAASPEHRGEASPVSEVVDPAPSASALFDVGEGRAKEVQGPSTEVAATPAGAGSTTDPVPHFSMAAIVTGGLLWLEDLEGRPLAREQLQLVQAMSRALAVAGAAAEQLPEKAAPAEVSQFDWPMHNNRQLGLGEDAARASLAGFVGRKLESGCRGLVLLGKASAARLALEQMEVELVVRTSSTAEMLASPQLKRQVWHDLSPLLPQR